MKTVFLLGATALLASAISAGAATVPVFFDDFDVTTVHDGAFDSWNGTIGANTVACTPGGIESCLLLDSGDSITSRDPFTFLTGHSYSLTALFSGWTGPEDVSLNIDAFISDQVLLSTPASVTLLFTALADFDALLMIQTKSDTPDGLGVYLDSVTLAEVVPDDVPAVPVPASAPLLLAGLGAMGLVSRRKARA